MDGGGASARDRAEAELFAAALARLEGGAEPVPAEDAELAELTALAARLRSAAEASTSGRRYHSYQRRALGSALHRLEAEGAAARTRPGGAARRLAQALFPVRRWPAFGAAGVASVAVTAGLVLAIASLPALRGGAGPADADRAAAVAVTATLATAVITPAPTATALTVPVPTATAPPATIAGATATATPSAPRAALPPAEGATPEPTAEPTAAPTAAASPEPTAAPTAAPTVVLTPYGTLAEQLAHIDTLLGAIAGDVESSRPVPLATLRSLSESLGAVAYRIEAEPEALAAEHVVSYLHQAAESRIVLAAAEPDAQGDAALAAARRAAQDGVVTASGYLQYR